MGRHVLVVAGGWETWRPEGLAIGAAVEGALRDQGFRVTVTDLKNREDLFALVNRLREGGEMRPDVIFNTVADGFALDGHLHAIFDMLQIPYCQSGHLASALACDKPMAKMVFAQAGIPVAKHVVLTREEAMASSADIGLSFPVMVKPADGTGSLGARVVWRAGDKLLDEDNSPFFLGKRVLVEEFIEGQELTVWVMGDSTLEPVEVIVASEKDEFFSYEAKYPHGGGGSTTRCVVPAEVPAKVRAEARRLALLAHRSLGCRGVTRTDFRYNGASGGKGLVVLELNPQPGLGQKSSLPLVLDLAGISFGQLVCWMVDHAECDK